MRRFLILSALVLSTTLIGPAISQAAGGDHHEKRYYDRDGRDYHTWNDNEDRAYLQEQHQDYREFRMVKRDRQQQYFKWRHEHPDNTLFKVEIH